MCEPINSQQPSTVIHQLSFMNSAPIVIVLCTVVVQLLHCHDCTVLHTVSNVQCTQYQSYCSHNASRTVSESQCRFTRTVHTQRHAQRVKLSTNSTVQCQYSRQSIDNVDCRTLALPWRGALIGKRSQNDPKALRCSSLHTTL